MADIDVIETLLDSKTQEEIDPITQPDPPAPVIEDLTPAVVEQMLQLARNGASKQEIRATVLINNRRLRNRQVNMFWREWRERRGRAARRAAKKAAK